MDRTLLIIEDGDSESRDLPALFSKDGYRIERVNGCSQTLEKTKHIQPHAIILDLDVPNTSGIDLCREIRSVPEFHKTPLITISSSSDTTETVLALEFGADDYITKPCHPRVLHARLKAIQRRIAPPDTTPTEPDTHTLEIHDLIICLQKREVQTGNSVIDLTFSEFQTLYLLASNPGRVYTRYQIVEKVHGNDYAVTDRSIDVLMVSLRRKLKSRSRYIETVRGVGYRFLERL